MLGSVFDPLNYDLKTFFHIWVCFSHLVKKKKEDWYEANQKSQLKRRSLVVKGDPAESLWVKAPLA